MPIGHFGAEQSRLNYVETVNVVTLFKDGIAALKVDAPRDTSNAGARSLIKELKEPRSRE